MAIFLVAVFAFIVLFVRYPAHALYFDLSLPSLDRHGQLSSPIVVPQYNQITVTSDDQVLWNCEAVTQGQLVNRLFENSAQAIEPILVFYGEPNASYNLAAQTLFVIKSSGATKVQFVGLGENRQFSSGNRVSGAFEISPATSFPVPSTSPAIGKEWRFDLPTDSQYSTCEDNVMS